MPVYRRLPHDEHGVVVSTRRVVVGSLLWLLLLVLFNNHGLLPRFLAWVVASALNCIRRIRVPLDTLEADVRETARGGLAVGGVDAASPHHRIANELRTNQLP
jgi:hypothetical protein